MISDDSVGEMPLIVLASASPRRRELMKEAGYAFAVEVAGVDCQRRGRFCLGLPQRMSVLQREAKNI